MSEDKTTPGEWTAIQLPGGFGEEGYGILSRGHRRIDSQITGIKKDDAILMAASKDLRDALVGVLRIADRKTIEFDAARAALRKAGVVEKSRTGENV